MAKIKKRILTCDVGNIIISGGRKMVVAEIITPGRETYMVKVPGKKRKVPQIGERSEISACVIMPDNGQVMTRNPRCIGQEWEHV